MNSATSTRIELWPHGAPIVSEVAISEVSGAEVAGAKVVEEIRPHFDLYLPQNANGKTAAVVICPGGGYGDLCTSYEGEEIAQWLCARGIAGLVLHYRHAPHFAFPAPQLDAQRALRMARANAEKWNLRAEKIGVLGFSAGGHLAATCATLFDRDEFRPHENSGFAYSKAENARVETTNIVDANSESANNANANIEYSKAGNSSFESANFNSANLESTNLDFEYSNDATRAVSSRPDFAVLCYPVISMSEDWMHAGSRDNLIGAESDATRAHLMSPDRNVSAQTPPTFLFHTSDDEPVPVRNSLEFYAALREKNIAAELHIYEHGSHGVGFAQDDAVLGSWPKLLETWLQTRLAE